MLYDPPSLVAAQRPTVRRGRFAPVLAMRDDELDAACRQSLAQRITVVISVGNQAAGLLPVTTRAMPMPYADRQERRLDEFGLRRGGRVKVVRSPNRWPSFMPTPAFFAAGRR